MKPLPLILAAVIGFALCNALAQDDAPYKRTENLVYAEVHGVGLLADIFVPVEKPNGLGIIDVVSGAWYSDRGKLRDHERGQIFNIYCKRGYTVFAMRPGSVSKYDGAEMLNHVKLAIRWVKAHASEYGVDPNRLGMTGASAGGHLALLASVTPEDGNPQANNELARQDTRVKATAVFFPPTDLVDWDGKKPDYNRSIGSLLFAGGVGTRTQDEIDTRAKELSPRYRITDGDLPKFLLIHGDADPMVPLQQSHVFIDAVNSAGGSAELIIKPGGAHPWPTIFEEVALMADWFDKTL